MEKPQEVSVNPYRLLIIILLEGFVTIAVEMLTIRQLITVVGNSVIITSLIIGIFLLFLALGYYKGGKYQTHYTAVLIKNFTGAALLLGVGLSYLFIQVSFLLIFHHFTSNSLVALIVYLACIIAPLVYLLGQTVPITTNLFKFEQHVGSISGKVLCISTLGSFLGSVVTTLILMNYLGVAWTVFINFALLIGIIFLLLDVKTEMLRVGLMLLLIALIYLLNVAVENKVFTKTNNYGDYQLLQNVTIPPKTGRLLNINNAPSSFLTASQQGFDYIEYIKKILFSDLAFFNKDILVLGAGGFTLSAESDFGNRFTYIDIDGSLPAIVKKGFTNKINGQFISEDARKFLMYTNKKYDAVVSDVYSSRYTIPFHLLTREYFQHIQNVLKAEGVAIFNIIADPTLKNDYSKRLDNTIRSVFKNCMSTPLPYRNGPTNIIYICTARPNTDGIINTDDKNRAMIDIFNNK